MTSYEPPMEFKVTADHLKLLRRLYMHHAEDYEYGGPSTDQKRPYGNSDVEGDIAEILGWELITDRYGEKTMTEEQGKRANQLHKEVSTALQIALYTGEFAVGKYRRADKYCTRKWERMS